jgi:hypothetical protein
MSFFLFLVFLANAGFLLYFLCSFGRLPPVALATPKLDNRKTKKARTGTEYRGTENKDRKKRVKKERANKSSLIRSSQARSQVPGSR